MKKMDSSAIRKHNLLAIYDALQHGSQMTRQAIAQQTRLSLMSVTNLVDQLLENQAICVEKPPERQGGARRLGRKAEIIRLDTSRDLWLVINLTGYHFSFVVLRADRRIAYSSKSWGYQAALSYEENLRAFLRACARFREERLQTLRGAAVVLPGPYDNALDAANNFRIPELNGLHIRALVAEELQDVFTYLDEDVKFAARAYAELFADMDGLYYLYIGEGVGGAMVYRGQLLHGLNEILGDPSQLPAGGGETFEERLSVRAFLRRLGVSGTEDMGEAQLRNVLVQTAAVQPEAYWRELESAAGTVADILNFAAWMLDPHGVVIDCVYARGLEREFARAVRRHFETNWRFRRMPSLCPHQIDIDAQYYGAVKVLEKHWIESLE